MINWVYLSLQDLCYFCNHFYMDQFLGYYGILEFQVGYGVSNSGKQTQITKSKQNRGMLP